MNYREISQYYGKSVIIYYSIGIPMFDKPVLVLPEEDQKKTNRRFYIHINRDGREQVIRVHSIGKIEVA